MLLYRKQSLNNRQYINSIKQTLNDNDINIIFGDFNINYLSDDEIKPLKSLMTSLDKQVVQSPTFEVYQTMFMLKAIFRPFNVPY